MKATACQFRGCTAPAAVKAAMLCEHDAQYFCFVHSELMKKMISPTTFMQCAAKVDEDHPHSCGLQGLAEDVYQFNWMKEGQIA